MFVFFGTSVRVRQVSNILRTRIDTLSRAGTAVYTNTHTRAHKHVNLYSLRYTQASTYTNVRHTNYVDTSKTRNTVIGDR